MAREEWYYECCEHCDKDCDWGDKHVGPCPDGCNEE